MKSHKHINKSRTITNKQAVLAVVRRLRQAGYQALLAGGCVRDMLLGKLPHDYDVATDAKPQTISKIFPRTLTVGAQFGVVVVLWGGKQIEVATFRSDSSYEDGRRPDDVVFTDTRHDALRRDFTINGMFYDPITAEVIDYVGGRKDLQNRIIRAIGNPQQRFAEDHLRMLRAIRFASRLDFHIEKRTWKAILRHADKIQRISSERVADELERTMIDSHRAVGLQMIYDSGLDKKIFSMLDRPQLLTGIEIMRKLPKRCSFPLVLAGLLSGGSVKQAEALCHKLKLSNKLRRQVCWLVAGCPRLLQSIPLSRGMLKKWLAEPLFDPLLTLCRGYLQAMGKGQHLLYQLRRQIQQLGDEPISPPRLLDGHELIRLGAAPGPMVGQLVQELYLAQLENEIKTKSDATDWVKNWLLRHEGKNNPKNN